MANLHPYLSFDNAKEAMEYYERTFGATDVKRMSMDKSIAEKFGMSEKEVENATMHGSFSILGNIILCSDKFSDKGSGFNGANTLLLDFNIEDEEDMNKMTELYKRVEEVGDCEIEMKLEEQYWGGYMARFKDPYGLTWMLHGQKYSKI